MAALNFGSTRLATGAGVVADGGDDLAALRRALEQDEEGDEAGARPCAASAGGAAGGRGEATTAGSSSGRLFDRAFAAHALSAELAASLMVPESERVQMAPRAALGDMLRHALVGSSDAALPVVPGGGGSGRPLRAAELALWFSCVDAEAGGALVSLAEYRRGVAALRARVRERAGGGGGGGRPGALPPPPPPAGGTSAKAAAAGRRAKTDVTRGAGEGTSMAAAYGELVARHAHW
jgi:hypothetical protein